MARLRNILGLGLGMAALTTAVAQEGGLTMPQPVVLQGVVDEFTRTVPPLGDLNPIRTNLLMRLVCLRAAGATDVDYTALVMLSGGGTAFAYAPQAFWVMKLPPDGPAATEQRLARGTGLGWEELPKVEDAEGAWRIVKESVDAGKPVQGTYMDDYLFVGYQGAEKPEEREVFTVGGWSPPRWMSWRDLGEWAKDFGQMSRPTEGCSRADDREMTTEVLRRTLVWADHDGRAGVSWIPPATYGIAGMEAFAADVADMTKGPDYWTLAWLGCHGINRQSSGRKCAGEYLERAAALFPGPVGSHLGSAAPHYRAAYSAWNEFGRQLGRLNPDAQKDAKAVWSNPERRKAGAAAIREAAKHERKAVGEVGLAVEEIGETD